MKYNFDEIIARRNTNSTKWDMNKIYFENEDILDLWIADMDFPSPQPVVDALKQRLEHPVFGYTFASASMYEAIVERVQRRFGWQIRKEWIVFTGGVIDALYSAVHAFARPGDEIVIQPPVYYPFYDIIKNSGAQPLLNQLINDNGSYHMDIEGLKRSLTPRTAFPARIPRAKALLLCSPHNPVGRVWSRQELLELSEVCLAHNCLIFSDEIHCDLLSKGMQHNVTSSLSQAIEQQTLTFMSASKTFNLAGLGTSFVIIPNDKLRQEFVMARAGRSSGNIFGHIALEAAFRHGDDYLEQLLEYLDQNTTYFNDFMSKYLPELKVTKLEGTYLAWVDMRSLNLPPAQLQRFMRMDAGLALDDGYAFGPGGEGYQRFNLACPRAILQEALVRLERAVKQKV